jgi:hypothetical protein
LRTNPRSTFTTHPDELEESDDFEEEEDEEADDLLEELLG